MEEMINTYKDLVRNSEGKRSLGRPGHRGEENIKMDHKEVWWKDVD
jgi:hypothetical protein